MKIRPILMTIALVAASAAAAHAAALKVVSFNGPITIKTAKGLVTVNPGEKVPPIKNGDEITVVSGEAVFQVNGEKVTVEEGSSFSISVAKGAVVISPTAGSVAVTKADGSVQQVKTGESATVSPAAPTAPKTVASEAPAPAPAPAPTPSPKQEATVVSVSPSAP